MIIDGLLKPMVLHCRKVMQDPRLDTPFLRILTTGIILLAFTRLTACHQGEVNMLTDSRDSTGNEQPLPFSLPQQVPAYLNTHLPGWTIADTADYIKSWWSFYDRTSIPFAAVVDINDDGAADYACIVKNRGRLGLVILLGTGNTFTHWLAPDFNEPFTNRDLHYGLTPEPPGQIDIARPAIRSLILRTNAINLSDYEQRTCIYYWKNNQINTFRTR